MQACHAACMKHSARSAHQRTTMTQHNQQIREHFDRMALDIGHWRRKNSFYHDDLIRYVRYLTGPGRRILELGSGTGDVLAALKPATGIGVDLSEAMVTLARQKHPDLTFVQGDAHALEQFRSQGPFDFIILSDLVGYLEDVQQCLAQVHALCDSKTRVIITSYNFLWEPALKLGEKLGMKMPTPVQSWLSVADLNNLLTLTDFQPVKSEQRLIFPFDVPLISPLLNHLGTLPVINKACLSCFTVARARPAASAREASVSIVIPCRNEKGNIEPAIRRIPAFGTSQEIIFVDGHSRDGTPEEIERVIAAYPEVNIRFMTQEGKGKGDAVRMGFAAATGDILMILDADLTVPPEDLPRFYQALVQDRAEFLNGSRLVYPMEDKSMRLLNLFANKLFAMAFSWLLGQRLKDTLCGTKVLWREDYEKLVADRAYFSDFDPFGDFDLLFGASKLNLKLMEIPIRYRSRTYGETQISRFRHGYMLLKIVIYAYRKLKTPR
jgi:ubiquinone/menaquinone biosynthesis C-methylase UbiE